MDINYVKQMNAFLEQSSGVLNAREQAVYLRLFGIWNKLKRPAWFNVAYSQLMRETMIRSKHTIIKAKQGLQEKGFIQSMVLGDGKMFKYHLNDLTSEENVPVQKMHQCKKYTEPVQKMHHTGAKNAPIIKEKEKISTTTTAPPQETTNITSTVDAKVLDFYQQNIRPVCSPYESDRLADDIAHYGADIVIKGIERAVLRGKRSLGYVESILKRWEADGYDEEGDTKNGQRRESGTAQPARRNQRKTPGELDRERAEWFAEHTAGTAGGWPEVQ